MRGAFTNGQVPSRAVERELWATGCDAVAGMDEVGRGAWAGPLAVGVAVLPRDRRVYRVRDSKALSEDERERIFDKVASWCRAWAVGFASPTECDDLGMSDAQRLAAARALGALGLTPDALLVDGRWDFTGSSNTRCIVRGDVSCLPISAASILAKVTRDRLMRSEAEHFPAFEFASNKGYPCPRHVAALHAFGLTPIHRSSWAFVERLPWGRVDAAPAQASLW
ncbi:MAG: ribonuclease HII [Acidimicrobiia bacterium]